jgi:hypothetical protein
MRRLLWTFLTAGALASGFAVAACGEDDNAGSSGSTPDSGSPTGTPDSGFPTGNPDSGGPDAGDGGCTFAGFVINLINTQTTPAALPSTDLGHQCAPSTSQTDFASLFQ